MFFGRNDAKAETPILWPPHTKNWLIGKDSDAGRDWGQEEKGTTEGEMAGWHHWLDGCESEWTPGVGDGQGGLACCDSWGHKESDTTERLNWTELNWKKIDVKKTIQQLRRRGWIICTFFLSSTCDLRALLCITEGWMRKGTFLRLCQFASVRLGHWGKGTGRWLEVGRKETSQNLMALVGKIELLA